MWVWMRLRGSQILKPELGAITITNYKAYIEKGEKEYWRILEAPLKCLHSIDAWNCLPRVFMYMIDYSFGEIRTTCITSIN